MNNLDQRYSSKQFSSKIKFVDEKGTPLKGITVNLNQKSSSFLFGCGAFETVYLCEDTKRLESLTPEERKRYDFYTERINIWTRLFNYGTLPFYWGGYEPTEGNPQSEGRKLAAEFLKEHGAIAKGHPLCWHTACADWLMEYDDKTIMDKQLKRIERDVTEFKGIVDIWDVINETVIMPVYDRYDNAITRICKRYGRTTLIKEVFEAAHAANPDALLLINDFNLSDEYKKVIDEALNAGAPIGAIGLQTHQHQGYKGLDWLNTVLDRFSVFNLPIHFTENTLVSGKIMPPEIVDLNDYQVSEWPSTPEGEARQAREWEEMYRRLFEHPLVGALTGWDFGDGAWLNAPSGLIRKDNTVKPSYEAIYRLSHEEWHTNADFVTDENGCIDAKGYKGEYEITFGGKIKSMDLSNPESELCIIL